MTYPATFKYTKDHEWVDVSDLSFRAALLTRFLRENP